MTRKIQVEVVDKLYHLKDGSHSEPGSTMLIGAPFEDFSNYIARVASDVANGGETVKLVYTKGLGEKLSKDSAASSSKK